ncbi:phosphoribosylanthranilate isomerase [Streptomyces roseus]|uniref:phosphoribosylanthranilate isomerase n=1 Tax=Streptomyces roseus TaxID=66430 RepID=UPI0037FBB1CB
MGIIQIAGVLDVEDARTLVDCDVDWVGIPLRLPVHTPDVDDAGAARIASAVGPGRTVVITYLTNPEEITSLCCGIGVDKVQLHGDVSPEALAALRTRAPRLFVIKSVIIRPSVPRTELAREARAAEPYVDMFIADSHDPRTGADGATGLVHDWTVSTALARELSRPFLLAGGLRPDNVKEAIETVTPAGVDAHTGVEAPDGRNDPELVRRFVTRARAAFAARTNAQAHRRQP